MKLFKPLRLDCQAEIERIRKGLDRKIAQWRMEWEAKWDEGKRLEDQ